MAEETRDPAEVIVALIGVVERDAENIHSGFPEVEIPVPCQKSRIGDKDNIWRPIGLLQRLDDVSDIFPEQGFTSRYLNDNGFQLGKSRSKFLRRRPMGVNFPSAMAVTAPCVTVMRYFKRDAERTASDIIYHSSFCKRYKTAKRIHDLSILVVQNFCCFCCMKMEYCLQVKDFLV